MWQNVLEYYASIAILKIFYVPYIFVQRKKSEEVASYPSGVRRNRPAWVNIRPVYISYIERFLAP